MGVGLVTRLASNTKDLTEIGKLAYLCGCLEISSIFRKFVGVDFSPRGMHVKEVAIQIDRAIEPRSALRGASMLISESILYNVAESGNKLVCQPESGCLIASHCIREIDSNPRVVHNTLDLVWIVEVSL